MKIYISGRITNNPHYEEDFNNLEDSINGLKDKDIEVINPIKMDKVFPLKEGETEKEAWLKCMERDMKAVADCDAIILMKGSWPLHRTSNWKKSPGAIIEYQTAKKFNKKIFFGWRQFYSWWSKLHKYDGLSN